MRIFKQDKLFIVVVLVILISGLYFFAAYIPIKYEIRKDYTGMEYAPDTNIVSDDVKLHIYGYYYDYILETHNSDYFRGKFEISSVPITINNEAYFLIHDSLFKPNIGKKEIWMYYPMVDGIMGHIFMEKQFSKMLIELSASNQSNILIFPAESHEQAVGIYNELESVLYGSNLKEIFSESWNIKDIVNRLTLTEDWELEENKIQTFSLLYQKKKVASITEVSDFAYGSNSQMIVSNWIGMHADIVEEEIIAKTDQGDRIDKVLINIEPSAAEQMNGAEIVQELHYFYVTSDNFFIDIVLLDDACRLELEELLCGL